MPAALVVDDDPMSGEPIFDAGGRFRGYRGVGRDITARKRAERILKLEHAVVSCLAAAETSHAALQSVIRAVCETEDWECGRFFEVNGVAGVLRLREAWTRQDSKMSDFVAESRDLTFRPGVGLAGRVWQSGEPLWVPDVSKDPRTSEKLLARVVGIQGAFIFPVTSEGKVTGVLAFSSSRVREPDGRLLQAVHAIGSQVGQFLQRKRAEEVLRESEERFRSLTELSSDWYWEQDENLRFVFRSGTTDVQGRAFPEGALGKARWELPVGGVSEAQWQAHKDAVAAREPFRNFEYRLELPGEPVRHVSVSGEPMFDADGGFRGYRGVGRDVTERKLADERLAAHAARQEWIARFGQRALKPSDIDTLLEQAAQAAEAGGADGVVMYRFMPESGRYMIHTASGIGSDAPAGTELELGDDCVVATARRSALPVVVGGPRTGRCSCAGESCGAASRASINVPIRGEQGVFAVLTVLRTAEGRLTDDDVQYVKTIGNIVSSAVQRQQAESRLDHLARYDSVTGLPNRNLLRDRLDQAMRLADRQGRQLAALFVDLDRFKLVNDTLGHQIGDRLLAEVAVRLRSLVRSSDTVARVSGDEFVIVLPDLGQEEAAAIVAQKVLAALSAPFLLNGHEASIGASIGIAIYPANGHDAEALLKAADAAMYKAKDQGRGAFCFFTPEMERRSHARMQLQTDLRRAIEREEFQLVYQPKVDLESRRICGVEALLRWHHPTHGVISPADFIPALEETGLIVPVGEWVVRAACRQIRAWRKAGRMPVPVAVNVSARQFQTKDLDRRIVELILSEGVDPRLLELEITESYLVKDPEHAIEVLRRLREAGLQISIDDFGTGYSSLTYLTRFPVSALKVDRSFVRDATTDANSAAIVRAVIDMAHDLGFTVVAEGVENGAQVAFLKTHRCDFAQGYYFGKPVRPAEILPLLAPRRTAPVKVETGAAAPACAEPC